MQEEGWRIHAVIICCRSSTLLTAVDRIIRRVASRSSMYANQSDCTLSLPTFLLASSPTIEIRLGEKEERTDSRHHCLAYGGPDNRARCSVMDSPFADCVSTVRGSSGMLLIRSGHEFGWVMERNIQHRARLLATLYSDA